ncbi:MAG: reverse transcriptase-like protein [Myxococcales bacterium]|nr:reverse transcriptase-like protein [Myxococcales bacterium]MCB9749737.1 reverse transcriptase-like protein [Myxococcales bacterium]
MQVNVPLPPFTRPWYSRPTQVLHDENEFGDLEKTRVPWKKFQFRDQTVFARILASGKPIVHRGRVEIRYKLGATKSYRASPENLEPVEGEIISDDEFKAGGPSGRPVSVKTVRETPKSAPTDDTIIIHTDGACSGNPGPAGIGIYLERPDEVVEICEFISSLATNNFAELTAIDRALELLRDDEKDRHILLYTDSGWSLGVLIGGWKAKTNLDMIKKIQARMTEFSNLELLKVKGHSGQKGNEEADYLATTAVRREASKPARTRKRSRSGSDSGSSA